MDFERLLDPKSIPARTNFEREGNSFVKSGAAVKEAEVEALQMMQQRLPEMPMPRLHSHSASGPNRTIKMDFIEGETLAKL